MSAVDAPPGLDFAGLGEGEFRSKPRSRRLAMFLFTYVMVTSGLAFFTAARHPFRAGAEFALVLPMMCASIVGLGLAVRRARLHLSTSGIRWGWSTLGFRMPPSRIRRLTVYRDAVAVQPKRGSLWYLAARDWDRFDEFRATLRRADLEFEDEERKAPLRSRLQSYGLVLDGLMLGAALLSTLLALSALAG